MRGDEDAMSRPNCSINRATIGMGTPMRPSVGAGSAGEEEEIEKFHPGSTPAPARTHRQRVSEDGFRESPVIGRANFRPAAGMELNGRVTKNRTRAEARAPSASRKSW